MLPSGQSFTETYKIGDLQLVMSLYGDVNRFYDACFACTISNSTRADEENTDGIEPMGIRVVSFKTVQSLDSALTNWVKSHENIKFHRFATDEIYNKLLSLFKKAGYSF